MTDQHQGEEEEAVRRHDRHRSRGRDDADQESERQQCGDDQQDHRAGHEEARMNDVGLPHHDQPDRSEEVDHVAPGENQAGYVARKQQLDPRHRTREVEIDRSLLLHPRHKVRGGKDRQERAEEVEDDGEARLESEHELFDADGVIGRHGHVFAEQLRAGQRSVDDVKVYRRGEDHDEDRREKEVGEQRPAGCGLPHDVFDVGVEDFHGDVIPSVARDRCG